MADYRRGYVTIYVDDVIEEISDEDLLAELSSRKLIPLPTVANEDPQELIREAYDELIRGHVQEAHTILDRLIFPKWKSAEECQIYFNDTKKGRPAA